MPDFLKEAVICFKNVSGAIMAEQALVKNRFSVRVMPAPSAIQGGCGFCLRFLPEDLERAVAFLSERGFSVTEAYLREEAGESVTYRKISAGNGERNATKQ